MAEEKIPSIKVILGAQKGKPVRFSYLHVHEAKLNSESKKMEYSVAVLIPKDNTEDIKAVKDAIEKLKKQQWPDAKKKVPPGFWNPLRDGDEDTKQDGSPYGAECKGHYVLNCKSDEDKQPNVVGTTRGEDGKFNTLGKSDIRSGDWGRVSANLYVYIKGTGGVGAGLSSVQLTRKGEPLAGNHSAEEDFGDFDDDEADPLD